MSLIEKDLYAAFPVEQSAPSARRLTKKCGPVTLPNRPGFGVDRPAARRVGRLITAVGCQARTVNRRIHTSFPRLPFEHALPRACAGFPGSLSCFGHTARKICPLLSSLPLLVFAHRCHPVRGSGDSQVRHELLRSTPPLPQSHSSVCKMSLLTLTQALCLRFPRADAPEHVGYPEWTSSGTNHGSAPMAVWISATHVLSRALRALSYPETSDFSECRAFQVSPPAPATLLPPHQPSSAEQVALLRHTPCARLSLAFASCQDRIRSRGRPFPRRPTSRLRAGDGADRGGHCSPPRPLRRGEPY